ncbi:TRAP transporter small permease [Seohaeicola zhoushanensis]|uniref:TRAP transporter small permease protein n=1 Tax=Seohaeicola zhoushanensis TaxID=1569283 RepID=A0A8J3M9L8_9RHOB|nr:TRAP transporter small permease [Seohaeicola zhoushanensis]GHF49784.1 hypothetical protein GCM10017056_22050 [Seohaeicola zhoushanensis]
MIGNIVDVTSKTANWLAALLLFCMFGHILYEVILRNFFDTSTFVLDEFVGYAVSGLAFLALGESLRRGEMLSVAILETVLPRRIWAWVSVFANALAIFVGAMMVFFIGRSALINLERGTTSSSVAEIPQVIPQAILCAGAAIFVLRAIEMTWKALGNAVSAERI